MTRSEFKSAYRSVRIKEFDENNADAMLYAARARFCSRRLFGVEASRTAPDFRMAILINLRAVRYRRANGHLPATYFRLLED